MNKTTSIIPRMVVLVAGLAAAAIAGAQPAVTPTNPAAAASGVRPAHRPRAVRRRRARHRARRRAQGAGGTAGADPLRHRHQHGRDRRRHLRRRASAGRDGEDRPRRRLGRDLPRPPAARGDRRPAQGRRLQDAVRAGVRREGRRARAAQGRDRGRLDRVVLPRRWPRRRSASPTSASFRSRSGRWPPTSRPASRSCSTTAASRRRCARACRCRARLSPVEIDGRLLVDGGIANNLPIDEARKLCADVVIAVNISTPPLKRKEITSALSRDRRSSSTSSASRRSTSSSRAWATKDVLIAPDLGDISAAKFDRSADAIAIGEEATRALADKLTRYSLPPEQYRGAARNAGRRGEGAGHGRRDPRRRAGAHEPGGRCARWSRASPASR